MTEKLRTTPSQEIISQKSLSDINFVLTAWGCTGCKLRLKQGEGNRYFGEALENFRQHVMVTHVSGTPVEITWIYIKGVPPKEPEKKFQSSWHTSYGI